jgi:hypothetical protein
MRNLTRLTVALMATVLLTVGLTAVAEVGHFQNFEIVGPLGQAQTALDTNPVFWVKYIGDNATANVEVDATTGDIEFTSAAGADTSVSCPETDDDGVLDVSAGACDTWIEIVNACNQAGSDWACALGPVLGSDNPGDALATLAATDEDLSKGLGLHYDSDVDGALGQNAVVTSLGLYPVSVGATTAASGGNAGSFFFTGGQQGGVAKNPFEGYVSIFARGSTNQTSAGTIAVTNIYEIFREYRGNPTIGYDLFERVFTRWTETGAATTADGDLDFQDFPLVSSRGSFFALETGSSTDQSTITNIVAGVLVK